MNVHIALLMWRIRMHFPNVHNYTQLVNMAFSAAPDSQRQFMVFVGGAGQKAFLAAMLGIYILSCGRALGSMFYDVVACLPTWTLLACGLILPFHATARKLGTWKSLIWLNVATICGTCIIPLAYMWNQGLETTRPPGSSFVATADLNFRDMFSALSTFTFAFTSQFMIIEIISEMKDPSQFPQACMFIAAPFQCVAFLLVGIGGYYFVGDQVAGMIGDTIPFGAAFRLAAICLLTHMVVTFIVKGIILCRAAHSMVDKDAEGDDSSHAWQMWAYIVTTVTFLAWLIANVVPFFNELVDLTGASLTPVCCYIVPIVCYLRWVHDFGSKAYALGAFEATILMVELALAVSLLVFGTYFSVSRIIDTWDTFGPPFGCHCENMWNTCQCSGKHAGMLDQCPLKEAALPEVMLNFVDPHFAWMIDRHIVGT
jgi:hypothetical protein